jgi:photosystem II stability/assembly factor-like uncharacterized protein
MATATERSLLVFITIVVTLLIACGQNTLKNSQTQISENRNNSTQKTTVVKSTVTYDPESLWRWQLKRLNNKENLSAIQIFNKTTAWIVSNQSKLYKTSNKGETWNQVHAQMPRDSNITSVYFANDSIGWMSVARVPPDVLDTQNIESWILYTNDGGLSWGIQYSNTALEIQRVLFINDHEGWAIGSSLVKRETLQNNYFVIHTTDQGKNWVDVSAGLNLDKSKGYVADIYAVEPSKATLVTSSREVFGTTNGGHDWNKIGAILDEPAQTTITRIGVFRNNLLWVLGGTDGREGIWSTLALKSKNDSWVKYKIDDVYLSDINFLSDTQLIGSGSIAINNKPRLDGGAREGVILYSADGGRNWVVVYRNEDVSNIHSLYVIDFSHIWAVGEKGLILQLNLPV